MDKDTARLSFFLFGCAVGFLLAVLAGCTPLRGSLRVGDGVSVCVVSDEDSGNTICTCEGEVGPPEPAL